MIIHFIVLFLFYGLMLHRFLRCVGCVILIMRKKNSFYENSKKIAHEYEYEEEDIVECNCRDLCGGVIELILYEENDCVDYFWYKGTYETEECYAKTNDIRAGGEVKRTVLSV